MNNRGGRGNRKGRVGNGGTFSIKKTENNAILREINVPKGSMNTNPKDEDQMAGSRGTEIQKGTRLRRQRKNEMGERKREYKNRITD